MMASKVGSVALALGRAFSTRRMTSLSCGFGLGGIQTSPSSLPGVRSAEAEPSVTTSATRYNQIEGVLVVSVVVPELELVDVERHVGVRHLMVGADDAAFDERPEAFDALSVHRADNILVVSVPDDLVRVFPFKAAIADPLVCDQQTYLCRDDLAHEAFEGRGIVALDHAGDHVAVALDSADDRRLARAEAATTWAATVADMSVLGLTADIGFVNLNLAEQLPFGAVLHRDANSMAHIPSRFIGAGAEHPVDLMRAHTLLRVVHEERDLEPFPQRIFSVLEDGAGDDGEPIAVLVAALANPMERLGLGLPNLHIAAARAVNAIGPTPLGDERFAVVFGLEPGEEFVEFHTDGYMAFGELVSSAG